MNAWFVSDYHFFHKNILRYENRPFASVEEMNETIIKRHNERVKPEDLVYFLGDFSFYASKNREFRGEGSPYRPEELQKRLNGVFAKLRGNHDKSSNKLNIPTHRIILNKSGIYINLIHRLQDDVGNLLVPIDDGIYYHPLNLCGHSHCFDEKTEILTDNGWKTIDSISYIDRPISLDIKSNILKNNEIQEIIKNYIDTDIVKYKGDMNFCFTLNHRLFFKRQHQKNFETNTVNHLLSYKNSIFEVPISGNIFNKGLDLSDDEIRLIVWICADGSIDFTRPTPFIRFKLSKIRKIKALKSLLKRMNIDFSINIAKKENYQKLQPFRINLLDFKNNKILNYFKNKKQLPKEFYNLSKHQADILFETYIITDGILYKNKNIQLSTSKKEECDLLQIIAILNGYSCCYSIRKFNHKNWNYVLCLVKNRNTLMLNTKNLYKEHYKGRVWCLTVPFDTLITRRNGHVIISHNSKWQTKEIEKDNKIALAINVSVENNNYYPFSFDEIMTIFNRWKANHPRRKEINRWIIESRNRPIYIKDK